MNDDSVRPVIVLGAGVNGAAVARELAINGVPVWIVDRADIAQGASAKSSRLIHGGLRYLEYREIDLVRESLDERRRLLDLAPQFVHPLELFIPVRSRFGGSLAAARRFLHLGEPKSQPRGLWLARIGLWMYDLFARDRRLPWHRVHRQGDHQTPPVNPDEYRWLCSYFDAQMPCPERFTLALLEDARRAASILKTPFRVLTYTDVRRDDETLVLRSRQPARPEERVIPSVIVNATGAWGDFTMKSLDIPSRRLLGGTKGSHFLTFQEDLRDALRERAIYVEADDGRLMFILPLNGGVYVGTTDLPFDDDPDRAIADGSEIDYLIRSVNEVFPQVSLRPGDIAMHCCGVRPLPFVDASTPSSITRRHAIVSDLVGSIPIHTLVGGKLTTCRALGEQVAGLVLEQLRAPRRTDTRARPIPGSEDYPRDPTSLDARWRTLERETGYSRASIQAAWALMGTACEAPLRKSNRGLVAQSDIPVRLVEYLLAHEWVQRLEDLVERRLLLVYQPTLTEATLVDLARRMADAGLFHESELFEHVRRCKDRLTLHYGRAFTS